MKNTRTFPKIAYLISSSLLTLSSPVLAQETQNYVTRNCDLMNYMVTESGNCIDLNYLVNPNASPSSSSLLGRFQVALSQIGVPIKYLDCVAESEPGKTLYGFYKPLENIMVICPAARKNKQQFEDTLVHESWHTVQDCIAGIDNGETVALSEVYPDIFQNILGATSLKDYSDVISLYPDQKQVGELEARYMQDKPDLVLKALRGICRKK